MAFSGISLGETDDDHPPWVGRDACRYGHLPNPRSINMDALLTSISLVTIAEIGDKTQLLSLILAARYRTFWPIIWGILIATLLNHGLSAGLGYWLAASMNPSILKIAASLVFIAVGVWALIPDKAEDAPGWLASYGAFAASCIAFFIAEIGDKTQLATIGLAAQFNSFFWVTLGTTIGMLIANIPAVMLGEKLLARLPLHYIRFAAAVAFIGFGIIGLMA